jgi:hypothetical protein
MRKILGAIIVLITACNGGGGGGGSCGSSGISGTYSNGSGQTIVAVGCGYSFIVGSTLCQTGQFSGDGSTLSLVPSYSSCSLSNTPVTCSYSVHSSNSFTVSCPAVSGTFSK